MPRTVPYDFSNLSVGQLFTGQWHDFRELGSSPVSPPTGYGRLFSKDDGAGSEGLWWKESNGVEILLTPSGGLAPADGLFVVMTPNAGLPNAESIGNLTATDPLTDDVLFNVPISFVIHANAALSGLILDDSSKTFEAYSFGPGSSLFDMSYFPEVFTVTLTSTDGFNSANLIMDQGDAFGSAILTASGPDDNAFVDISGEGYITLNAGLGQTSYVRIFDDHAGAATDIFFKVLLNTGNSFITLDDGDGLTIDIGAGNFLKVVHLPTAIGATNDLWNNMGIVMQAA